MALPADELSASGYRSGASNDVAGREGGPPEVRTTSVRISPGLKRLSVPAWIAVGRIVVGVLLAHAVLVLFPEARQHLPYATLSNGTWLGAFHRWDGEYYVGIASHGYLHDKGLTAFFPGYPLLVRVAHAITFGALGWVQTAIVVSWIAFVGTALLLYDIVRRRLGPRVALVAVTLFCWSPVSLFFLSPYSESLFVLQIAGVVALLDRRRFLPAACVAAYASATSPEAVALTLAIVVTAWLAGRAVKWVVTYALISGLGIAAYMAFLWIRFGDPFEFDRVQGAWHRSFNLPFLGLVRNLNAIHSLAGPSPPPGGQAPTYSNIRAIWILDDVMLLVAGLAVAYMITSAWLNRSRVSRAADARSSVTPFPASWLSVAGVMVLIAACTTIYPWGATHLSSTEGEARFVTVALPLFGVIAYALRRRTGITMAVITATVSAALLFQIMYNLGYWVT
jgi:hypothetical protein